MKVLFVCHSGIVSGAERALLDLLEALPATVRATVACPSGELEQMLAERGVDVVALPEAAASLRLDTRQLFRAGARIFRSARVLRRIVQAQRPDVIHANSLRAGLVILVAGVRRYAPTVVHVHDVLPPSRVSDMIRHLLCARSDAVVGVSRYASDRFIAGSEPTRVYTLYNPLDTIQFCLGGEGREEARELANLPTSGPLLGMVAQITPWKGHDVAIRAMARIREDHPDAQLLIVGAPKFVGPSVRFDNRAYLRELENLVKELGLDDHVRFLGERQDVPRIMRALDLLLCPSWEEPFGRSVIEAMAVGTPVVATEVGGPAEVIRDGEDGVLLPPRDVERWAETIARLVDDPTRRQSYGERGSESVRARFDSHRYAEQVVAMYEELRAQRLSVAAPESVRDRRLRILFLEHGAEMGGAQHSLLELVRVLGQSNAVAVACPHGPLANELGKLGVEVIPIPPSQLTFRIRSPLAVLEAVRSIRTRRAMRSAAEDWRPDVLHANTIRAGLLAPRGGAAPLIVHCRDLLPTGSVATLVRAAILRRSSAVIAVSKTVATRLAWGQPRRTPVFVVDNPVNTGRFAPGRISRDAARQVLGVSGGPFIAVIAQITPWKGQLRAIRILSQFRRSRPDAQLLLVGETKFIAPVTSYDNRAYELELRHTISQLGLDHSVHWLGERQDVETVMAALDVLLVPSTEEPFGRTVIEALSMNVPVIGTDAGGPPEVIRPGIDGYTLPPEDYDAWSAAIGLLVDRGAQDGSREYVVERFSTERHAEQVLAVYGDVLARLGHSMPSRSSTRSSARQ